MDATVVVATFGAYEWQALAARRAVPSAQRLGVPVIYEHGSDLHGARNSGLERVRTEWVIFLDADDELEPGYVDAMATGSADVRAPSVRYVTAGSSQAPAMPRVAGHAHDCEGACLLAGNWLVIGACARTELVRSVGGFRDFAWSEDWDLWLRCHLAGASIEPIPDAVYRAWVSFNSRNRAAPHHVRLQAHQAIAAANGIPG